MSLMFCIKCLKVFWIEAPKLTGETCPNCWAWREANYREELGVGDIALKKVPLPLEA